jgi:hypothetical protein
MSILEENQKLASLGESSAFFNAMRAGDLETFRNIATKNPKILQWQTHYPTILHYAADCSSVPVVEYLLSLGFDVNSNPHAEPGAKPTALSNAQFTPLYYAAGRTDLTNREAMVHFLVERGADVNAGARKNATALHAAVFKDNQHIVRYLLEHGADPRFEDWEGRTPLALAIESQSQLSEAVLREKGAPLKGIPVDTRRATGTVKVNLPSFAPKIRKLLQRAVNRYLKEHGEEKVTCVAFYASGVYGFVSVGFETGPFEGDVAGMKYARYETFDVPWWEDAYQHADKVLITSHTGRIITWNPSRSGDAQYERPFFRFLVHLLKEFEKAGGFERLPKADAFQVGIEIMEGYHATFWKLHQNAA